MVDDVAAEVREAMAEDRCQHGLSYRQQAALLGIPRSTLHLFGTGRLPLSDEIKRAAAARYPHLVRALTRASLEWLEVGDTTDPRRG